MERVHCAVHALVPGICIAQACKGQVTVASRPEAPLRAAAACCAWRNIKKPNTQLKTSKNTTKPDNRKPKHKPFGNPVIFIPVIPIVHLIVSLVASLVVA